MQNKTNLKDFFFLLLQFYDVGLCLFQFLLKLFSRFLFVLLNIKILFDKCPNLFMQYTILFHQQI